MELKDTISDFVEAVIMNLKNPGLHSTLIAFDPDDRNDRD